MQNSSGAIKHGFKFFYKIMSQDNLYDLKKEGLFISTGRVKINSIGLREIEKNSKIENCENYDQNRFEGYGICTDLLTV